VGEAVFTITLGTIAASLALVAFGTTSIVEVFASAVVLWHLRPGGEAAIRTAIALRLVAISFGVLASVLAVASIRDLASGRLAGESWGGVAYLAVTAVVMGSLALAKRRVAIRIGSEPLAAEAKLTMIDAVLSLSTLTGLVLNAALSWWWADPAAALIVSLFAFAEAKENWEEARSVRRETVESGPE
jgi:divalent metal cation (Fe/Co/Zn/Cd) transporter